MIWMLVCRNHNRARIAWDELFEWQRPPSFAQMHVVLTDSLMRNHWRGWKLDPSEVMLVEDWADGQFAPDFIMEAHYSGLNLNECGRLYYDER